LDSKVSKQGKGVDGAMAKREEEDESVEIADDAPVKTGGKKKLILFAAIVLVLLIAVAAGLYFSGVAQVLLGGHKKAEASAAPPPPPPTPSFHDLPAMLVNLNTNGRRASYLKLTISLQLDNKLDDPKIDVSLPRILDTCQVYMRELRFEDLKGSAGLYRLREELLMRISQVLAPVKIDDVLFKEMVIQ
jgi:flagellar FliL protein